MGETELGRGSNTALDDTWKKNVHRECVNPAFKAVLSGKAV
jgi:hypothetical protein